MSAKTWQDDGFRTWRAANFHWFWFRVSREDYQGDKLFSITVHLVGRAFQYLKWTANGTGKLFIWGSKQFK